jgi:HK97 family phage major capsid protein
MTNREKRESRAKLINDAQALLKKEGRTAEDVTKANTMLDDADVIKAEYETEERAAAAQTDVEQRQAPGRPNPGQLETPEARTAAEKEAFRQYIVTGRVTRDQGKLLRTYNPTTMSTMSGELRDMNGDTGADGGYIVPTGFNAAIEQATLAYGAALTVVSDWRTESGQPIQWPLSNDTANYSQEMTDGTDVTEQDIPLGQVTFNTSTFSTGVIKVSRSLVTDAAFDLGSFIEENFGVRYARGLNLALTNGSTSGSVQGLVGGSYSAVTSLAPTAITYPDLVATYTALDPSYLSKSTWMFHNAVLRGLIGLEDLYGRPLFVASITSGIPDTILGRPFVLNQAMVGPAAGSKSLLFGDMTRYKLRTVGGLEVLKLSERYAPSHQYGYVAFHRHSGKLLDAGTHPVICMIQHA